MKKYSILAIFISIVLMSTMVFASSSVMFEVVEKNVCEINLSETSVFRKELIKEDTSNKEVTLQLSITNGEESSQPTGELMLVIDNSESMTDNTESGTPRKDLVYNSAKTLIDNLLKDNTKLQVGITSFSSSLEIANEGTSEDAQLVSKLSNSAEELKNAIDNIEANGPRTDLESGITLASSQFSEEDGNKYMIVLTDGIPNISLGHNTPYYSDDVINNTKTALASLEDQGIQLITMLTGIDDENDIADESSEDKKTYGEIIEGVFGTEENPSSGKFYYIEDNEIEQTITESIYNDLKPVSKSLKDITIVDYFPQEIVDNFEFSIVSKANIGDVTASIDPETRSITWTISELEGGQTGTVQYKLKLKDKYDSSIVDKILDTNEKVDITYTDANGEPQEKTSDVTPKVKITEPPAVIPKAGTPILVGLFTLAVALFAYSGIKLIR